MVVRNLVSRLALVALVLTIVVAAGCSSGGSENNNNNNNNNEPPAVTNITGTVFLDEDGDGLKAPGENGIADIVVSNGVTVTATGSDGGFSLPKEGSFVFVTVPNTHAPSGLWYRNVSDTAFNFGLKPAPERSGDDFTFIHMTDLHLDDANLVILDKAVEEFKTISPAFVVCTGDLVNTGDPTNNPAGTQTISEAQAAQWFGAYKNAVSSLTMPVFNAMGNHDAANIACESATGATAGCSKDAYRNNFGPTYYSFDWGQYHCVVLDPNGVSAGKETFSISGSQWSWLQADLGRRAKNSPLLVFFHEPTCGWRSYEAFLTLLKQYKTRIFSGGAHQNLLMDSSGVSEQVTAALSGEWGHGDNPDGSKPGYRIVSVTGSTLDDFYKEVDSTQQIEMSPAGATWPIVNGQVELAAKVFGAGITGVTYAVDNNTPVAMTLTAGAKWVTAKAAWDTASVPEGYHQITIAATGGSGTFEIEEEVKVSTETTLTAADLQAHLRTYQGHYVTVQGTVEMAMFDPAFVPEGAGGAVLVDSTGKVLIYAGQCYNPALPTVATGSTIRVKVVPMRFTWGFMTSSQDREGTFDQFTAQESFVPAGQKEDSGGTKVARWYMRVVRASDIVIV
ncbi:MAG: metallophosphoesterase [Dehalococcoidia bacterium]|nr:metallophosphoesterase [Dehalococcoidia bacterium]